MASAQGLDIYVPPVDSNVNTGNYGTSAYSEYGGTGRDIWNQIARWLGFDDQEQKYQNALTADNRRYEAALANWFDSTAVQRRVADIKAAGLNPWLALQSGGIGANGSMNVDSGSSAKTPAKTSKNTASGIAMLLIATAKLLSAL